MPLRPAGKVTSGTMSPSLGIGIGLGYVPAELAAEGTEIEIDARGRPVAARVAPKPLYVKETHE
jgi:aminomethyltransferase